MNLRMRKKFIEDFSLPVKVFADPYFDYFLTLYGKEFKVSDKLGKFNLALDVLGEEELCKKWYQIKDAITLEVMNQPKFKELESAVFSTPNKTYENQHPYNMDSLDKTLVSIDVKTGNFTALKEFDSSLVLGHTTYKDFISQFTPFEYFHDSKIFRQLIFEPLLAKKQGQIQKQIILDAAEFIKKVNPIKIKTVSNDELILVFQKQDKIKLQNLIIKEMQNYPKKDLLKVDTFDVIHLGKQCFYKENFDGEKLLRKVPGQIYPQAFKKMIGMELHPYDLIFIDGETKELSQFLKPIL